jgi:GntR family transcriptional regulator
MWFHVDPASGLPIYMQIINQVKRSTASGLLKEGDQMPSVRELALQLTVNPNTISKAYQELERDGVIKTMRGVGTFVAGQEIKIVHEERVKVLQSAIDKVLVEAHHLGFTDGELEELFINRVKDWRGKKK